MSRVKRPMEDIKLLLWLNLKNLALFKALALFCGNWKWPPTWSPPGRSSGNGWALSFLLWGVRSISDSLFPSREMFFSKSSFLPSWFFWTFYIFLVSENFGIKKLILSHFPWPICLCTRHFTMESHIIKARCLRGKFQFSIMVQFNIKCHFLPNIGL